MKKLIKKDANKLFKAVSQSYTTPEVIEYKFGEDTVEIELYSTINPADIESLIDAAVIANENSNPGETIKRDYIIASMIIEYFTNIPVPKIHAGENEVTDLFTCYEIVYGYGGLQDKSEKLKYLISEVVWRAEKIINARNQHPMDQLALKILELYELFKIEMSDVLDNPARQENIVEAVMNRPEFLQVVEGMKKDLI